MRLAPGVDLIKPLWSKFTHAFRKLDRFVIVNYLSCQTEMVCLTYKR